MKISNYLNEKKTLTPDQLRVKKGAMNILLRELWDPLTKSWLTQRQINNIDDAIKKAFKYDEKTRELKP